MHAFINSHMYKQQNQCNLSLYTGEAVAVSVAATFTISIAIGLLLGMALMHYIKNRGHCAVRQQQESSVPGGPV